MPPVLLRCDPCMAIVENPVTAGRILNREEREDAKEDVKKTAMLKYSWKLSSRTSGLVGLVAAKAAGSGRMDAAEAA